jgi:hypothetical protein
MTPYYWFRKIEQAGNVKNEPFATEFLKIETGETYIHTFGSEWFKNGFLIVDMIRSGITHFRILNMTEDGWNSNTRYNDIEDMY